MAEPNIVEIKKMFVFQGRKYWLSGTSKYFYNDRYFGTGKKDREKKALHHAVWEFFTGQIIPKGAVIHHKDKNPFNNAFENLELKEASLHRREHLAENFKNSEFRDKNALHLKTIRSLASKWHGSKEGIVWHRHHAKQQWLYWKKKQCICLFCSKQFESFMSDATFCSRSCEQKNTQKSKRYFTDKRKCLLCKKEFMANRFKKVRYCCRKCGIRSWKCAKGL